MAAKICVSIGAQEIASLLPQANRAFRLGADYIEIRFDFLKAESLETALDAVAGLKDRMIFTLRSQNDGGIFTGSEDDRLQWLRRLAEQKPMLLDVELDTLRRNDDLADFMEKERIRLLVSWHDFEKTPPNDVIVEILSEMRRYSNYVKIVTKAETIEDALRILDLYDDIDIGLHPILFAMGQAGVISRILCTIAGNAPFTYASLDRVIAPGQLSIQQLKKLYDRMKL